MSGVLTGVMIGGVIFIMLLVWSCLVVGGMSERDMSHILDDSKDLNDN